MMWGWPMVIIPILWLAVVALFLWGVARWLQPPPRSSDASPPLSAEEILRQRFARGEIDGATFAQIRATLHQQNTPSTP